MKVEVNLLMTEVANSTSYFSLDRSLIEVDENNFDEDQFVSDLKETLKRSFSENNIISDELDSMKKLSHLARVNLELFPEHLILLLVPINKSEMILTKPELNIINSNSISKIGIPYSSKASLSNSASLLAYLQSYLDNLATNKTNLQNNLLFGSIKTNAINNEIMNNLSSPTTMNFILDSLNSIGIHVKLILPKEMNNL